MELTLCRYDIEDRLRRTLEENLDLLEKALGTKLWSCGSIVFPEGLEADLVLVSEESQGESTTYIPVVVEFKRMDNREIRREVLAQLLEYITAMYLHPEEIIQACASSAPGIDVESLEENIKGLRMRGIIVSEKMPDIVKKTIEIMNKQLATLEIYGLELKRLCSGDGAYQVIIPLLIGASIEADKKRKIKRILWTYESLRRTYSGIEDEKLRNRLLDLLDWARSNGLLEEYMTSAPRFKIYKGIITVEPNGKLYVRFGKNNEDKLPKPRRQQLLQGLQELGMLPHDIPDADAIADGKGTQRSIADLTDEEYSKLKDILTSVFSGGNPGGEATGPSL